MAVGAVPHGDLLGHGPQGVGDHRVEGAVRHELLELREGAYGDARDLVGALARELGVDLRVVLPVVADQQPPHVGQHARQAAQFAALVLGPRAEPPGVRRAEVGHEETTGREVGALQEGAQRGHDVPRPRGQVQDGRVGGVGGGGVGLGGVGEELRHAVHRLARGDPVDEGVLRRRQQAGQHRDDHGVIDVGDDPEVLGVADDPDGDANGFARAHAPADVPVRVGRGPRGRGRQAQRVALAQAEGAHVRLVEHLDRGVVPPGGQAVPVDDEVDVAAAVREGELAGPADCDEDRLAGDLRVEELAPAPPAGQPGALQQVAVHEDAAEHPGAAEGADAAETDDAGVEAAPGERVRQHYRGELAGARRQGQQQGGRLVVEQWRGGHGTHPRRGRRRRVSPRRWLSPRRRRPRSSGAPWPTPTPPSPGSRRTSRPRPLPGRPAPNPATRPY